MVMVVSRWPASVVAEVSLVSTLSRHSCLCAKKFALLGLMVGVSAKKFALLGLMVGVSAKQFALLGLMVGVSAKKFAQRMKNGPQSAVCGVPGEFFRENTA